MRFRGTLVLLVAVVGLGLYLYFYEYKGAEQRDKAKQEENRIWKFDSATVQQIDLIAPQERITAVRSGEKEWKLTSPLVVEADAEELNRMASSASDISRESVLEANAADLSHFGLQPPQLALHVKTKDGKEYKLRLGNNNPTGNSTYAAVEGKNDVVLVASYTASSFKKKPDDLRNRNVLTFEQSEAQSLTVQTEKGTLQLAKENDKWSLQGQEKWPADSSAVSTMLSGLSSGRVKEFFAENPDDYVSLGFDKPTADVRVTYGKDRALKHLTIGLPKSKLQKKGEKKPAEKKDEKADASTDIYIARDESRKDLFFVEKDLVDKLSKSATDLRDKALAVFQRWDVDGIVLTNAKGTFTFAKPSGGDWVLGDAKKKTKWDAVNGILDALEKQVKEFIDAPAGLSTYGLDKPAIRVVVKQGADVKVDCAVGKEAKDGVYVKLASESFVKIADKEILEKLNKGESDFVEAPAPAPAASPVPAQKK